MSCRQRRLGHLVPPIWTIAQLKFLQCVFTKSARFEIRKPNSSSHFRIVHLILEVFIGVIRNNRKLFALAFFSLLFFGLTLFFNLNIVPVGQPAQGFRIGKLLVLHQEINGVSAFSRTEIFVNSFRWNNEKTRCFFIHKRRKAAIRRPTFFQMNKLANHIFNKNGLKNSIYGGTGNHGTTKGSAT